jgi:hypothetical protein
MSRFATGLPLAQVTVRGFALLACGLYLLANLVLVTQQWAFDDIGAYLGAAERLQNGAPLYFASTNPTEVYLYAPWFAFLWIPLSHLPRLSVEVGWAVVLVTATGLAMAQFRRSGAELCLAFLLGALLYRTACWGNVQPLIVVSLMYLLPTRAGPWAVGVAASLKVLPILFLATYAWQRDWRAVSIGLGVAVLLWAPAVFFDLAGYPTSRGLNLYDATWLLALPAAVIRPRHASLATTR